MVFRDDFASPSLTVQQRSAAPPLCLWVNSMRCVFFNGEKGAFATAATNPIGLFRILKIPAPALATFERQRWAEAAVAMEVVSNEAG
jgi:hypothetical protein